MNSRVREWLSCEEHIQVFPRTSFDSQHPHQVTDSCLLVQLQGIPYLWLLWVLRLTYTLHIPTQTHTDMLIIKNNKKIKKGIHDFI